VPMPRAIELRDLVHTLVRDVRTVLKPPTGEIDIAELDRVFTIPKFISVVRCNDGRFLAVQISTAWQRRCALDDDLR
jgi:hypothetical protein